MYIDKQNFGIVKVEENWETFLDEDEIKKYYKKTNAFKNELTITIKEEFISYYNKVVEGKRFPSAYFNRTYREGKMKDGEIYYSTFENNSYLYDHEFEDVEEIDYEHYGEEKQSALDRVEYDAEFWNSFDTEFQHS